MKKLTSLVLLLLLLCGCAKNTAADVTKEMREADGFSACAIVHYGEKEYRFTVEKDPETIGITINTPEALNGFCVTLTEETYTVGYHDVSFTTDRLPQNMEKVIGPVFTLCDVIAKQEGKSLPDGVFSYQTGDLTATCQFDMESGTPLLLQIGHDFTLEFTDFTYT